MLSFLLAACSNSGVRSEILESHTWVLAAYETDGKKEPVDDQATRLQFSAGELSGNTGCNQIGGTYALRNSRLTTEGVYTTKMACPGMMEREGHLIRVLNGQPTLAMAGEELLMSFGGTVLTFQPVTLSSKRQVGPAEKT